MRPIWNWLNNDKNRNILKIAAAASVAAILAVVWAALTFAVDHHSPPNNVVDASGNTTITVGTEAANTAKVQADAQARLEMLAKARLAALLVEADQKHAEAAFSAAKTAAAEKAAAPPLPPVPQNIISGQTITVTTPSPQAEWAAAEEAAARPLTRARAPSTITATPFGSPAAELGRKFEAVSKSPFMQAIQAFANSPEAKRLAQWTELANNPEVRRWADLSRSLQTTLPRHFIPPRG